MFVDSADASSRISLPAMAHLRARVHHDSRYKHIRRKKKTIKMYLCKMWNKMRIIRKQLQVQSMYLQSNVLVRFHIVSWMTFFYSYFSIHLYLPVMYILYIHLIKYGKLHDVHNNILNNRQSQTVRLKYGEMIINK